jgi:type II secretory pathway component PulL
VVTSEELRIAALEASAKRGKTVAQRRIARRWLQWFSWSVVLPVIGLACVLFGLMGFVAYQYLGQDIAYKSAQTWIQTQFNTKESVDSSSQTIKVSTEQMTSITNAARNDNNTIPEPEPKSISSMASSNIPMLKIDNTLSLQNLKP